MEHPGCLPVLQRFGVRLGVGDLTVKRACAMLGVDTRFFLAILNTYLNADFAPGDSLADATADMIADYLEKTDEYYRRIQLPNIERHFGALLEGGDGGGNLAMLCGFFEQFRRELTSRVDADCQQLFPAIRGERPAMTPDEVSALLDTDFAIEEKLADLESFFVIHLRGDCNANLCVAVVSAIFALGRDLRQNNRIRQRILRPLAARAFES